jgi:hypothetical protein
MRERQRRHPCESMRSTPGSAGRRYLIPAGRVVARTFLLQISIGARGRPLVGAQRRQAWVPAEAPAAAREVLRQLEAARRPGRSCRAGRRLPGPPRLRRQQPDHLHGRVLHLRPVIPAAAVLPARARRTGPPYRPSAYHTENRHDDLRTPAAPPWRLGWTAGSSWPLACSPPCSASCPSPSPARSVAPPSSWPDSAAGCIGGLDPLRRRQSRRAFSSTPAGLKAPYE